MYSYDLSIDSPICIVCAMRSSVSESAVRDVCREDIDRACCVDG